MPDSNQKKDWYNNKELFEMIQGLRDDLQETRTVVRKYNGIRKDLSEVMIRLTSIEQQRVGKNKIGQAIREWGGWIVAILTLIILALQTGVI